MNERGILQRAIFVLIMLLIGLALTVWELCRLKKRVQPARNLDRQWQA
jgi:hypothetical protein